MSGILHTVHGPLYSLPNAGGAEILNAQDEVIGLTHDMAYAVLFSASTQMIDALLEILEICQHITDPVIREQIEEQLALVFEKIYIEAS